MNRDADLLFILQQSQCPTNEYGWPLFFDPYPTRHVSDSSLQSLPPMAFASEMYSVRGPRTPNISRALIADDLPTGFPDPFAVATVNGEQTKTTTVAKRTLNPYWNESFDLYETLLLSAYGSSFGHVSEAAAIVFSYLFQVLLFKS